MAEFDYRPEELQEMNEAFEQAFNDRMNDHVRNPRIECADGFTISVQADSFAYCKPRQDEGPHTHMEGGFPSMIPGEELLGYMEGDEFKDPCDTVYPYVPREVFEREFELHGGIVSGKLPD